MSPPNFQLSSDGVKFVGIPSIFLYHYKEHLAMWAKNFHSIGPQFKIWLQRDTSGVPLIIGDGSDFQPMVPIIRHIATLKAIRTRMFRKEVLIIVPADKRSAREITKHCEDLEEMYSAPPKWLEGMGP